MEMDDGRMAANKRRQIILQWGMHSTLMHILIELAFYRAAALRVQHLNGWFRILGIFKAWGRYMELHRHGMMKNALIESGYTISSNSTAGVTEQTSAGPQSLPGASIRIDG